MLRAAQYLRMSTEHQQYSLANQSAAIALYAAAHRMGIVRSYEDSGKSGIGIKHRKALQALISDVQSGRTDFKCILVYDVSRWGRFQDADEAAHYEYLCRTAGIQIHYCAELFHEENSTVNNLLKALKRTMAGEYSRELSVKVFAGQSRLAHLGFNLGSAPFGLRRLLIDAAGRRKQILQLGERKSLHTDRVVLVPGPESEVSLVRRIFNLCTRERKGPSEIASFLNAQEVFGPNGNRWSGNVIHNILSNPKYMGDSVWARRIGKLGSPRRRNSEAGWIVRKGAIDPIISPRQFASAKERLRKLRVRHTPDAALDCLRRILRQRGKLSLAVVEGTPGAPSRTFFQYAFGGFANACKLIGYTLPRNWEQICQVRTAVKETRSGFLRDLAAGFSGAGVAVETGAYRHSLRLDGRLTIAVDVLACKRWRSKCGWLFNFVFPGDVEIVACALLDSDNGAISKYYFVPRSAGIRGKYLLAGKEPEFLSVYRSSDLAPLIDAIARCEIPYQAA
ncbi:MAG TPA: recombinase family protein [Candidatus Angelobacter sp.]|nr:recombinase family protein [Candidatus Angelobacter sp.]